MELLKLLSGSEVVAQVISFLILLAVLRIFLWSKFLKILDDRKEKTASDLKKISDAQIDIEKLKHDYLDKLSIIEQTTREKIQEAVLEGRKITEEIKAKARVEAEGIIQNAKEVTKFELDKAKGQLKDEIIDMAMRSAENLIREKMNEDKDRRLVRDFLDNLDNKK
ncbi:MAG: F0F1 ATP synthase subunit B [Candidatus Omnitrophica bacterium]|nr:F0F1 ATP synthase subunit B [Candidatus Omnitrophota bacterium]MDD5654237.1 F0F1 ATP synthase subunit B [Candidatus Omnitrophota bacterium]